MIDLPWRSRDPTHLERARAAEGRVMLAGGLGPDNVREAIEAVRPWAVDSARSTESRARHQAPRDVRAWVEARADECDRPSSASTAAGTCRRR